MAPPLYHSRRRHKDQTDYNSFYNIKKTKLSARYPFLPKKQIERKIKHLWERASVEKRALMCLTSSSTTAKSPFKGTILQGLRQKKDSLDPHTPSEGKHGINGRLDPARTLRSSIKDPHSPTCRQEMLRSSAKKHVTSRRVSFNLEQSPPSRPTTRNSILQQERNTETLVIEKSVIEKSVKAKGASPSHPKKRELSVTSPSHLKKRELSVASPSHLKKRELSLEEKKVYEFEDEDAGDRMTQLKTEAKIHVFDPEEYNLESTLNSKIFKGDSQSPMNTPEQSSSKSSGFEKRRMAESAQKLSIDKKTVTRKNAKNTRNSKGNHPEDKDVKKRTKPAGRGRGEESPFSKVAIDASQSEDTGEVPWMVSAHPDSSSDEVQDDSGNDDEEQEAVYEYYHKSSDESSASTLPSPPQGLGDILSSPVENETRFSWNGVCFTKNSATLTSEAFDSQLSLVSVDAAEVMSVSMEDSMSHDSPLSEFGPPGIPTTSSPHWSLSSPENKEEAELVVPQKRRMYLRDEMTLESPTSSRRNGLDREEPRRLADVMQDPTTIISPASRKRKMRGQCGEDLASMTSSKESNTQTLVSPQIPVKSPGVKNAVHAPTMSRQRKMRGQSEEDLVSMTTTRKIIDNNNKETESTKKPVAVRGPSLVLSSQRNVLAETNSRPANPVQKTNKTKREKEDREPGVKTRRSGRMRKKEGMVNGSQTDESLSLEEGKDSPGMRDAPRASQIKNSTEHHPHGHTKRGSRFSKMKERDGPIQSDGILCDLFQPNISSDKRSFNPPSEAEFYQSCMNTVSSHLFLEENFFL